MIPKIETLNIERFRGLRQLKIEGLARVNLITGRNNTGKTSVLEAIRILASDASWPVIREILLSREEYVDEADEAASPIDAGGFFLLSSLFHGFPGFSGHLQPITVASGSASGTMGLNITAGWFVAQTDADGSTRWVQQDDVVADEGQATPGIVIASRGGVRRLWPLDTLRRNSTRNWALGAGVALGPPLSCIFISPYGAERTAALGPLWDAIALSDHEKDVVEALRIIDPRISAVSMVGGESPRRARTVIARAEGLPRAVPLRLFGDGTNRLFGIILSLVNANGGLLLIDEFENGLHHTVQTDVWRAVFKLARTLDVQVVATSHSWDAVESFQEAASEHPDEGVLIRLSRRGEDVIPTLFREDELAIATRDHIEVR